MPGYLHHRENEIQINLEKSKQKVSIIGMKLFNQNINFSAILSIKHQFQVLLLISITLKFVIFLKSFIQNRHIT